MTIYSDFRKLTQAGLSFLAGLQFTDYNYSQCVPIITYAAPVKDISATDLYLCHVTIDNAIRSIFSCAIWQSIPRIRIEYGFKSIYELFAKTKFSRCAENSANSVVTHLTNVLSSVE